MGMWTWGNMLPRGGGRWHWRWVWDGMGCCSTGRSQRVPSSMLARRIMDPKGQNQAEKEKIKKWVARASF
jgi:hypothetical protein